MREGGEPAESLRRLASQPSLSTRDMLRDDSCLHWTDVSGCITYETWAGEQPLTFRRACQLKGGGQAGTSPVRLRSDWLACLLLCPVYIHVGCGGSRHDGDTLTPGSVFCSCSAFWALRADSRAQYVRKAQPKDTVLLVRDNRFWYIFMHCMLCIQRVDRAVFLVLNLDWHFLWRPAGRDTLSELIVLHWIWHLIGARWLAWNSSGSGCI